MRLKQYWRELQRRHVVKAGIAYLALAWVITEVATAVLPLFKIPEVFLKWLVVLLAVGFPIWLILAWVYDFSWGSIQKTEDVPFDPEVSRKKNVGLNRVIIGGLAIAVILLLVNTFRLSNKVDAIEGQVLSLNFTNSLAILPFEDLSPNKDQRYFSDGLARSIYDRLARYKDLKLISPTSSFQYRNKDVSIEVIAKELDVRYILEGSVQLFNNRYRASINLMDTQDGSTIWSKTFEDNLENVLGTYDEVSDNVGNYLNVTLISEDVRKRKVDPEAYVLYLKAKDTITYYDEVSILAADSLIRRSITIDSNYEHSHYTHSQTTLHKGLYHEHYSFEESIAIGIAAAREAIRLNPGSIEGHGWLSNWKWHDRDANSSMQHLDSVFKYSGPNNAIALAWAAHQAQRTNQIQKAYEFNNKVLVLDPLNRDAYMSKFWIESFLGEYDEALRSLEKFAELDKSLTTYAGMEAIIYRMKGENNKALETLKKGENDYWSLYVEAPILSEMGRVEEADRIIKRILEYPTDSLPMDARPAIDLSVIYAHRDDHERAFEYLNKSFEDYCLFPEWLFTTAEYKNLYNDPRWDEYIDRLSEEFNYDFPHRPE